MAMASSLVIGKIPPKVRMQGIKVNSLWPAMIPVAVASFGTASGLANLDPVCCPVTGPIKVGDIHKGFGQVHRVSIGFLPVSA